MNFEKLFTKGFTVYSKSGCNNCTKVKTLLKDKNLIFNIVECDDYLIEDKENFLLFIKELSDSEIANTQTICKIMFSYLQRSKFKTEPA